MLALTQPVRRNCPYLWSYVTQTEATTAKTARPTLCMAGWLEMLTITMQVTTPKDGQGTVLPRIENIPKHLSLSQSGTCNVS